MTLSRGARGCLKVLESYLGGGINQCWPSQATIARQMGRTDRQVQRYIHELVACGILVSLRRTSNSPHTYRLRPKMSYDSAAADAAWDAARDAEWDAAATAAWDAAREAAWDAARDAGQRSIREFLKSYSKGVSQ
jgi:DNA-binding transcriptional MocR family regulator